MKKLIIDLKDNILSAISDGHFTIENAKIEDNWISFNLIFDDYQFSVAIPENFVSVLFYEAHLIISVFSYEEKEVLYNSLMKAIMPIRERLKNEKIERLKSELDQLQTA